jgi:HK97 family phage portal protein
MEFGVTEVLVNATPTHPHAISPMESERWNTVFQSGRTAASSVRVSHKSVVGYAPFFRGINLISNSVAGLPRNVYRRTGDDDREIATIHPAQRLIKREASPVLLAHKLFQTLQAHALLFGNGYAAIERNERMQPVALWPLDPQATLIRYVDGELWYCATIDGAQVKIPGRNVLHIKGLSHNGIAGYAILDIMADALGVGMAAQQFGGRFFGQGANMSGLLMVPGHFSEEKIRNTMQAWDSMYEGITNAHKVALLQEGVKFQQMTIAPEQAQFLQTRGFEVRTTVANILGVPPHLLGDETRTSHNSLEQENQSYLVHSLSPWLTEWESELDCKLLSEREKERGTHFIEFNREAQIRMQFKEKVDGIRGQMEVGVLSLNEARKMFNMPAVENGDARYRPANWMPFDAEADGEDTDAMSTPDTTEPPDEADDVLQAMIESSVTDAVRFERMRVVAAAKKEDNFCQWIDGFYDAWCQKSVAALSSAECHAVKLTYAAESKRQLLDAAGCSTSSTFVDTVQELVASWDGRTEKLVHDLRKSVK